jgi:uncharacterized protein GlcG (DUF336 family)
MSLSWIKSARSTQDQSLPWLSARAYYFQCRSIMSAHSLVIEKNQEERAMPFHKLILSATLLFTTTLIASVQAAEPLTVNIKRLSMDTALKIANAAIAQCRKEGVQIAVTVVDRGGHDQVVLRDTLAMDITIPISKQKAHTAMAFNTPLSQLEGRFKGAYQVPKLNGLIVSAGGIPINIGGTILGGIGVSGSPSGITDEKCATAGLDAVKTDLEMDGG